MSEQQELQHPKTVEIAIQNIRETNQYNEHSLVLITGLFSKIRPNFYGDYQKAEDTLKQVIQILENDPTTRRKLRYLFTQLFINSEILEIFILSGIETESNFFVEFRNRLKHKILPADRKKESLLRIIDTIFYKSTDIRWIEKIDDDLWKQFFSLLKLHVNFTNREMLQKLNQALHIVSCRIVTLSMNKEMRGWLQKDEISFFIEQNRLSQNIIDFKEHAPVIKEKYDLLKNKLRRTLKHCEESIRQIRLQSTSSGTSLQQTYLLRQISELITRLYIILDISNPQPESNSLNMVKLFQEIVRNENTKNSLTQLIKSNIKVLAYRIAEHEHDTGEHYIITSRAEYIKMLKSSMKGGAIAAIIALIKSFLHKLVMAPFWQGFTYSLNYASGFVAIHLTGSTLATKQPAMTASTIASAMDNHKNKSSNMSELAILLSKVWRSQTASFVGNLSITFPVALLVSFLYFLIFKVNIVEGAHAQELLDWQNPLKSKCLMYACNTGFFLYLSGLVSGFFDNRAIHGRIAQRINDHPFLIRFFNEKSIQKLAAFTETNMGPVMGNIFLGFSLGMAGFFGYIFGIDFDIRHITISTGQFAIGLQGLAYHVNPLDLVMTIIGILSIGFLNFLVSFSLAFFTAAISRGIRFEQYRHLMTYLRRLIARYPLDFIFSPKKIRVPEDLLKKRNKQDEK